MKHKFVPTIAGVVKDYHARMIPESNVSDCMNVMFKKGTVKSRWGLSPMGGNLPLSGPIMAIELYEQVRKSLKWTVVYTNSNVYAYNPVTGNMDCITPYYATGTAYATATAVTGSGTTWDNTNWDKSCYQIKFGTNEPNVDTITTTGTISNIEIEHPDNGGYTLNAIGLSSNSFATICKNQVSFWDIIDNVPSYVSSFNVAHASSSLYHIDADMVNSTQIIMAYNYPSGSRDAYAVIVDSATGVGTEALFHTGSEIINPKICVYDSTHAVICYGADPSNLHRADLSISGTSISVDTIYAYESYDRFSWDICKIDTNKVILVKQNSQNNISARIFNMGGVDGTNQYLYTSTETISNLSVTALSSTKALITFLDDDYKTASAAILSISGNTVTMGSITDFENQNIEMIIGYDWGRNYFGLKTLDATHVVVTYGFWWLGTWTRVLEISGTTIIAGNKSNLYSYYPGVSKYCDNAIISSSSYIVYYTNSNNKQAVMYFGVSGTALSISNTKITSIASMSGLRVGLSVSGEYVADGSVITSLTYSPDTVTLSLPMLTEATGVNFYFNVSHWFDVLSVNSPTGITLDTDTYSSALIIDSANPSPYVLRLCFSGDEDNFWSIAYPYLSSEEEKIMVCTNGIEPIMKWDGTGTLVELGGTPNIPPTAKLLGYYGAALTEHLIAAWTTDGTDNFPQTIELSDAGNPEGWGSAYYDFLQSNDEILALAMLKTRLVIYKKNSISLAWATPEGGNSDPLNTEQNVITGLNIPSGRTVIDLGDYHLFLDRENIWAFNGVGKDPVGNQVIQEMKKTWNSEYMYRSFAVHIPEENLYCLFIPTIEERDENDIVTKEAAESPDVAYCYNYIEKTWTIWKFGQRTTAGLDLTFPLTSHGYVKKDYSPTCAAIEALGSSWAEMTMRWVDLLVFSNDMSHLLGDYDGNIYEFREDFYSDSAYDIAASFVTGDYPLNDPKHTFMLTETVMGLISQATGDQIRIRASVDFGENWSAWIVINEYGANSYIERISNFLHKGLRVRFEVQNVDGSPFEIESLAIGWNDEMGKRKGV